MPKIIREINVRAKDCREKIKNFGPRLPIRDEDKKHLLWNMVTDFCESFKNQIIGRYTRRGAVRLDKNKVSIGVNIMSEFKSLYK